MDSLNSQYDILDDQIRRVKNSIFNVTYSKKKYILKDGYIKYQIYIGTLSKDALTTFTKCSCGGNPYSYCPHLLYIMVNHLKLSTSTIFHFYRIQDKIGEIQYNNTTNKILQKEIKKSIPKENCGICLISLIDNNYNLDFYQCNKCTKMVHHKCMCKWLDKINRENKRQGKNESSKNACIYCR